MKEQLKIDDRQVWLLKAALLPVVEAAKYWQLWLDSVGANELNHQVVFEKADDSCKRLLPLVYKNVGLLDTTPYKDTLKKAYKSTWLNNQRLLLEADKALGIFANEGIDTMLLKGVPFSLLYYKDMGLRPMGDIDLLVKPQYIAQAFGLLKQMGHRFFGYELKFQHLIHAYHSFNAEGIDIDIHRQVYYYLNDAKMNESFWADKQELKLINNTTFCLSDTHQMFHTIVHGFKVGVNESINTRWVADAWYIEKNAQKPIDWEWIIEIATKEELSVVIKPALLFLANDMKIQSLSAWLPQINGLLMTKNEVHLLNLTNKKYRTLFLKYWISVNKNMLIYRLYFQGKVPFSMFEWLVDKIRLGLSRSDDTMV